MVESANVEIAVNAEGSSASTREPREKVAVRLSPAGLAAIDQLAEAEHRTRSDMIRVLLIEAVAARLRQRGRTR